jgi:hypothetical protein
MDGAAEFIDGCIECVDTEYIDIYFHKLFYLYSYIFVYLWIGGFKKLSLFEICL